MDCIALHARNSNYEEYREAWHLLDPDPEEAIDIQACADENFESPESETLNVDEGSSGEGEM